MHAPAKPAPGVFERALRIKLKDYMERENISQRELAEKLGITEVRMSRMRNITRMKN